MSSFTATTGIFEDQIEKDEEKEPNDFMPDNYRKTLIRQIVQHAFRNCRYVARGQWITRAPSLKKKSHIVRQGSDE